MASDLSAKPDPLRKHMRTLTPVVPVLPLALSDRRWSRIARTTPLEIQSLSIDPPSQQDAQPEIREAESPEPSNGASSSEQPIIQGRPGPVAGTPDDEGTAPDHNALQDIQSDTSSPPEIKKEKPETVPASNGEQSGPVPQVDSPHTPSRDIEVELQSGQDHEDASELDTATVTDEKKERLTEEDFQSSEQELSSQQPSSATGLTDYGSSVADSTLETVVDNVQRTQKPPSMTHRQSEFAPEVLTNGFSPAIPPTRSSESLNGSVPTPAPLRNEPVPLLTLQEHLQYLVSTKAFSDTVLQVNQADRSYQPSLHYGHFLLLSRSDYLAKLIPDVDPGTQSRVINLYPARNILPHAFEAALRCFYTDSVLTAQAIAPQVAYQEKPASAHTLEYVMSYWMAGIELGLTLVKARSYELIKDLINWDTVEIIAKEAHDLRAAAEIMSNVVVKDEVLSVANTLARLISRFFVEHLNMHNFVINPNAQPTMLPARFAHLEFNRSHNPALSGVVFGSLSSPANMPSSPESLASAIILNMDFGDLTMFASDLARVHGNAGENIARSVVELREEKREHVLSNRSIPNKKRLSNAEMWHAAGWKEQVTAQGQVVRERVGYVLPTRAR